MDLRIIPIVVAITAVAGCTAMNTYTGSVFSNDAFSIEYPGSWNTSSTRILSAVFSDVGRNATFTVSNTTSNIEEAAARAQQLESMLMNYRMVKEENIEVDGKRTFQRIYRWTDAAHKVNITQIQTWVQGKDVTYAFVGTAPESDFQEYEATFVRMIDSFREK